MVKRLVSARFVTTLTLITALLTGCVTTTDSRFAREADRQKALTDYVQLASAYIGQGNFDRARHHLDRALEIDPNNSPALAAKGLIFANEGEPELAESHFRSAVSADSKNTRANVYYGAFLYGQGRMEQARDQFARASADTGYRDRGSVFFNLGMTQEQLNDFPAAISSYRRATELARGDPKTLLALSRVLLEVGDVNAADYHYSRLLNIMQRSDRLQHSSESLLVGVRIARLLDKRDQEASLALMLRNNFPESAELRQYKVLMSNGQ
jgi:type IV pilus assembly protein PilF